MTIVMWDFREKVDDKSKIFRYYHLNTKHSPRTQSFNAPKMDEKISPQIDNILEVIDKVGALEDFEDDGFTLMDAFKKRRTSWNFQRSVLNEYEFKKFVAYSFGINDKANLLKTYPSGGRLYPIEIYIIPTEKIIGKNKIFSHDYVLKYNIHTQNLELQSYGHYEDIDELISSTDIGNFTFKTAQFLVCLVGNPEYMHMKYHALTYRLMENEAGHIGQNMMLVCTALGLNSVPLGGFFEDRINEYINIANTNKMMLYVFAIG